MGEGRHAAHIVIDGPGHDGTTVVLQEGITSFGRLPSNDVILLGDLVSRNHSRITFFEGRATLQDLGSHNGSWVNGERVTTKVLNPGDLFRVGNFRIAFRLGLPEMAAPFDTQNAPRPDRAAPSRSVLSLELDAARAGSDPSTRALRFVLRAADALATAKDLASYMDAMLALALEHTGAQLAVYLEPAATGSEPVVVVARTKDGVVDRPHVALGPVRWAMSKNFPVQSDDVNADIRFDRDPDAAQSQVAGTLAVLCVPMGPDEAPSGALYLARAAPAFDEAESDTLTAVAKLASSGLRRWDEAPPRPRSALGRVLPEPAAAAVQRREESASGGLTAVEGVVLRAGLFPAGAMASRAREVGAQGHFYDAWVEAALTTVAAADGEILFGPGSSLTAVFLAGALPGERRAVEAAVRLRDAADALVARHSAVAGARLRLGVDQGRLLIGVTGGPHRLHWSVLGDPVEVAGRLETAAPGGAILVTDRLREAAATRFELRPRGEQRIRGRSEPLVLHEVLGPKG